MILLKPITTQGTPWDQYPFPEQVFRKLSFLGVIKATKLLNYNNNVEMYTCGNEKKGHKVDTAVKRKTTVQPRKPF